MKTSPALPAKLKSILKLPVLPYPTESADRSTEAAAVVTSTASDRTEVLVKSAAGGAILLALVAELATLLLKLAPLPSEAGAKLVSPAVSDEPLALDTAELGASDAALLLELELDVELLKVAEDAFEEASETALDELADSAVVDSALAADEELALLATTVLSLSALETLVSA